jgi:hypothetical protein
MQMFSKEYLVIIKMARVYISGSDNTHTKKRVKFSIISLETHMNPHNKMLWS